MNSIKNKPSILHRDAFVCLFLIVITLAVYWQVSNHEFVIYDDDVYVTENHHVQAGLTHESLKWAFTTTWATNWHPLTWLSHMLDCQLYGLNPSGHHLTNVLLHLANTLLLFLVLKRMTGTTLQSAVVAALFALHPLHLQSVAWVAERKDVLSTVFLMLTLWAYLRYVNGPGLNRYLLILLFFALGLMAKPMLVTLPFVLLLLDYWPLERFRVDPADNDTWIEAATAGNGERPRSLLFRLLSEKVPFFVLAAASSIVTLLVQQGGGAVKAVEVFPVKIRIANALLSYVNYIGKMIWPHRLAVFYPHPGSSLSMWQPAGAGLFLACVSIATVRAARRHPYLAVGWFWYLGTLLPVIGIVQVGSQAMADRYTYVPLIGLFIIVAWGMFELLERIRHGQILFVFSFVVLISLLMIVSWAQARHWRTSITLLEHTLAVTKNNYIAHTALGTFLKQNGNLDEAIDHYSKALAIKPDFAMAHYNLGQALAHQGELKGAIEHYQQAIRLKPNNVAVHHNLAMALASLGRMEEATEQYAEVARLQPKSAWAHNNLGNALAGQGKMEEAVYHYSQVLQIQPDYAEAQNNLGLALARLGRLEEAVDCFHEAIRLKREWAEAHNNLGNALSMQGKLDEAMGHYVEAIRLKPNNVGTRHNLARSLASLGRMEEATEQYAEVARLQPKSAGAHFNLGTAWARLGELDKASFYFITALQLEPHFAEAHNSLGVVLARQGKLDDAIDHFREALRLQPDFVRAENNLRTALQQAGQSGLAPRNSARPQS
jgi:tetratricopeptide (TPR) repeat protein